MTYHYTGPLPVSCDRYDQSQQITSIVYNGWLPVMPSIVYNYAVNCDWSRQSHDRDRANHSSSVSCDQLCPITANH
ncbi:unnamed protein product, partial [Staurois parvus]